MSLIKLQWRLLALIVFVCACKKDSPAGENNAGNPANHKLGLYYNYDGNNSGFIGQGLFDASMVPNDVIVSFNSLRADSAVYFFWNHRPFLKRTADASGKVSLLDKDFSGAGMNDGDTLVLSQGRDTLRTVCYKPFYIGSWQDLQAMRLNLAGHYFLMNDVVFPDPGTGNFPANGFAPIGTFIMGEYYLRTAFTGSFEGNGHSISHLNCRVTGTNGNAAAGLFGLVAIGNNQKISNFVLIQRNTDSVVNENGNGYFAGLVIGHLGYGLVDSVTVQGGGVRGGSYVFAGGLIGSIGLSTGTNYNIPTSVQNSSASCGVTGGYFSGGLIGKLTEANNIASPLIRNCHATGNVSSYQPGGLIGVLFYEPNSGVKIKVEHCYATGNVIGIGTTAGGLIGSTWNRVGDTITNCYATGNVVSSVQSIYRSGTGGLIGFTYSKVSNCFATGNVTGTGNNIGGLVGMIGRDLSILPSQVSNCFATGNVTGTGNNIGGLIGLGADFGGHMTPIITQCFSSGQVRGVDSVGGLIGSCIPCYIAGDVYAKGNVAGRNYVGGLFGAGGVGSASFYAGDSITGTNQVGYALGTPYVSSQGWTPCNKNIVITSSTPPVDNRYNNGYLSTLDVLLIDVSGFTQAPGPAASQAKPTLTQPFNGFDFVKIWQFNPGAWPTLRNMPSL